MLLLLLFLFVEGRKAWMGVECSFPGGRMGWGANEAKEGLNGIKKKHGLLFQAQGSKKEGRSC